MSVESAKSKAANPGRGNMARTFKVRVSIELVIDSPNIPEALACATRIVETHMEHQMRRGSPVICSIREVKDGKAE
jgi:hypothetical protein